MFEAIFTNIIMTSPNKNNPSLTTTQTLSVKCIVLPSFFDELYPSCCQDNIKILYEQTKILF